MLTVAIALALSVWLSCCVVVVVVCCSRGCHSVFAAAAAAAALGHVQSWQHADTHTHLYARTGSSE